MHRVDFTFQSNGTSNLEICESIDFRLTKQSLLQCIDILFLQALVNINDMLQFLQEPLINLGQFMNLVDIIFWQMHRLRNHKNTLVRRFTQSGVDICYFQFLILHKAVHALSDHTQTFLNGFLKCPSDSHHFAHRLHR